MARQLRIQYPGAFYHVTCRGNERQDIYRDKEDYEVFLEKLAESLDVYNVSLLGYVCMTNHFHLLVMTPDGNLSNFMRHFNIGYTAAFNRRYNRSGHLYQGRYKSYLVEAESYLKELSRYIHLNPVRIRKYESKDIDTKINLLKNYRFSSLSGYTNTRKRESFVNYSTVLGYFGGDTKEGRSAYRQFVYRGLLKGHESPLDIGKGSGIIGSEGFIDSIKEKYLAKVEKKDQREQPHLKEIRSKHTPDVLINKFCSIVGADRDTICTRGKNSVLRSMLMEFLYRYCNITQHEIGRLLGGVDYSTVSVSRKRLRIKMENDVLIKELFDSTSDSLSRIDPRTCCLRWTGTKNRGDRSKDRNHRDPLQ